MNPLAAPARLEALERSGLLRHTGQSQLTRLCYTTTALLGADAAQINVVTDSEQVFVAQWPREKRPPADLSSSGCREVVVTGQVIAVEDARDHPMMCTMPWVASWQGYIGAPLRFQGQVIGALCALSVTHRAWTRLDKVSLQGLADLVEASLAQQID